MNDLKWIKKHYGEEMSHFCRKHFQKFLETEGLLPSLLEKHFVKSRNLIQDLKSNDVEMEFVRFIYSLHDFKEKVAEKQEKTAVELMAEAGYILYPECQTEDEIQSFRHFYKEDEVICTITYGGRLEHARVWFAVKKNVDEIKRENFKNPKRQDEYGTSVISIQFSRGDFVTLSIKNRYNHTVANPDNTFNNYLDNIIPGLTDAFAKDYNAQCSYTISNTELEIPNYVNYNGKFYRYNEEINNIYYCPNNTIIKFGELIQLPNNKMLVDYFVFDFEKNTITLFDKMIGDCFPDSIGKIKKLDFKNNTITIKLEKGEDIIVKINDNREIVSVTNSNLTHCEDNFLSHIKSIEELNTQNLQTCGNNFVADATEIKHVDLPHLTHCGECFMSGNTEARTVNMPELIECKNAFFSQNEQIYKIDFPKLKTCGTHFFSHAQAIEDINLPQLVSCGNLFCVKAQVISKLYMPKLEKCGTYFLCIAECETVDLPNLVECGHSFFANNITATTLNTPKLKKCGSNFLRENTSLTSLYFPELEECDYNFITQNTNITEVYFPKLCSCGDYFLSNVSGLSSLDLPNLTTCGHCFMNYTRHIQSISLPKLATCGNQFLEWSQWIDSVDFPSLEQCGNKFMGQSRTIRNLHLPVLYECGDDFAFKAPITEAYMPALAHTGDNFLDRASDNVKSQFQNLIS